MCSHNDEIQVLLIKRFTALLPDYICMYLWHNGAGIANRFPCVVSKLSVCVDLLCNLPSFLAGFFSAPVQLVFERR